MNQNRSKKDYYYVKEISTRWMDNDIYGHVNNVTYYSYFDTVANQYLIEQGGLEIQSAPIVAFVVASQCEYFDPVSYPQKLLVALKVNSLGTSSVEYGLAIFQQENDLAVAAGSFTHVFVERASGKATPIPEKIRGALKQAQV